MAATQTAAFIAVRKFLLFLLPGIEVIQAQANRVPEPSVPDYVTMTELRRRRLSTTVEDYEDCLFTGSIAGATMTVVVVQYGVIGVGSPVFGTNVAPNTKVTALGSGTGGAGTYTVSPSQTLSLRGLAAGVAAQQQSTELAIQLDVHGPAGSDNAQAITTAFRSQYAVQWFRDNYAGVVPLYADDARQLPFINDQKQFEDRWVVELALQVAPQIALPQDFADQLTVTQVSVEASYPIS